MGQNKQTQGYQMTADDCYNKCKNETRITATIFMYHIVGNDRVDCGPQGCFCSCYDTRSIQCIPTSAEGRNLYNILGGQGMCEVFLS